jgi:hypothetical protein
MIGAKFQVNVKLVSESLIRSSLVLQLSKALEVKISQINQELGLLPYTIIASAQINIS